MVDNSHDLTANCCRRARYDNIFDLFIIKYNMVILFDNMLQSVV
jgi:hypothetical protein